MRKIILGTYDMDHTKIKEAMKAAIENKYDAIDTAFYYRNQTQIGQALTELKQEGIERIALQSKVYPTQLDEMSVKQALELTLSELQIDKIEYYMIHRPHRNMDMNIKAWKELIALKEEGLIEHIGVSNFDKAMVEMLIDETGVKPEFNQIEVSVQNLRGDRIKYNHENNIEIQGWSIMGNVQKNMNNPIVQKVAKAHGVDASLILIAFPLSINVVPVVKSATPSRIANNAKATDIKLTNEEIELLKTVNTFEMKFDDSFHR